MIISGERRIDYSELHLRIACAATGGYQAGTDTLTVRRASTLPVAATKTKLAAARRDREITKAVLRIVRALDRKAALQEREAMYWAAFERLLATALGPKLAADPRAGAVIVALSHPATAGTFTWTYERAGLDKAAARALLADLAVDAVRRISDRGRGKGGIA